MFSPSPSSATVIQVYVLPRVTLDIRVSFVGHLVPNFLIGILVSFPRGGCNMNRFCIYSCLLVISFRDRPWRKNGWMKAGVMDFLRTFAVASVGGFLPH
jgi:hypothetical protein